MRCITIAWSYLKSRSVRFASSRRHDSLPEDPGVTGYNDITPRGGVAWDLFGTGKTSVKLNYGKYLQAAQNGCRGCVKRTSEPTVTRAWTDVDSDFVPDCDLANPLAQNGDNRLIDSCAQISDLAGHRAVHERSRSEARERVGRASGRLADRRIDPASSCLRACQPSSDTPAAG